MTLDMWLAFAAISAVIVIIPGPTVMVVLSYALSHGRRAALPLVAGVTLGDFTSMTLSLAGLGALLVASAELFTAMKWIGAAYLVYLGIKLWRANPAGVDTVATGALPHRPLALFGHAYVVTALNPKSIAFFVAFLPQFLDSASPILPQFAIMEATFLAFAMLNAAAYAFIGASVRGTMGRPHVLKLINRIGGTLIIGAGIATAAMRR